MFHSPVTWFRTGLLAAALAGAVHAAPPPDLLVQPAAAPEGGPGESRVLSFPVSLSASSDREVRVEWSVIGDSATAGEDFEPAGGVLVLPAGTRTARIDVPLRGDAEDEPAETLKLLLRRAKHARLVHSAVRGTIANDDATCQPILPGAENPWLDRRQINFAHRGGVRDFPENTLYAYRKSVEIGADVLEMDVYQTADGEIVVIHDATVDRTTNGSGNVSDFTLAQLRELDAAYWFVEGVGTPREATEEEYVFRGVATGSRVAPAGYAPRDFRIPTLEEALSAFPDQLINIELKPDPDSTGSYEKQVADLLLAYGRHTDVMVASFLDTAASLFKAAAPCVSTSVPTAQAAFYVGSSKGPAPMVPPAGHQAFQVPPALGVEVVNADFVADAHEAGMAVHVWTINTCEEMVSLLDLDVDGIMTDEPVLLEKVLAQPPGNRSCEGL